MGSPTRHREGCSNAHFPHGVGLAAVLMTLASTAALAEPDFNSADTNHDGKATVREVGWVYPNLSKRLFDRIDEDHNGWLDEAEFSSIEGLTGAVGGHRF
jgi:hypothetical protein